MNTGIIGQPYHYYVEQSLHQWCTIKSCSQC